MSNGFRVGPQDIEIQRHVFPLYRKKDVGGYSFSSTMTFVKAADKYYCVFAAHALDQAKQGINEIGFLGVDGYFISLASVSLAHKVSKDLDLIVCCTPGPFLGKNYFNLDLCLLDINCDDYSFHWLGFPANKAEKEIHKTKSNPNQIQSNHVDQRESKFKNAEFLYVNFTLISVSDYEVEGAFDNKNIIYEHAGFKSEGTSLKGMSGGALFAAIKNSVESETFNSASCLIFLGIGLEYSQKNKKIKGASLYAIKALIDEMNIEFHL